MTASSPSAIPRLDFSDDDVTFFTIGDAAFFPGVAGLINSLRLLGYAQRIVVADCGFSPTQRDLLAPHATLVPLSRADVKNPQQYKAFPHLLRPRGTVAIVDSDIIVTDSIDDMLSSARAGKICVFPDPEEHRWFAQWESVFALAAPPRRQTYVNSGFEVFSTTHWPALLGRWWQACERIFPQPTIREGAARDDPTSQSDQDALNALLMSEFPADAIAFQPANAMAFRWDFERVHVEDERTLGCEFKGTSVVALHAVAGPKPWQSRASGEATPRNAYVRLLRRLLTGDDATVRVPPDHLPRWLRRGRVAAWTFVARGCARSLRSRLPRGTGVIARARKLARRPKA
jgi:hypothetical protein